LLQKSTPRDADQKSGHSGMMGCKNSKNHFYGTIRTRIHSSYSEGDFMSLPPEPQQGNIEYKLKLVNPSNHRLEHLVTQMKWRLREGQGRFSSDLNRPASFSYYPKRF